MRIYADLRWPDKTGIGVVKSELLKRVPKRYAVQPLSVSTRIGSPWSTFALAFALNRERGLEPGLFWSPGFIPPATAAMPVVVTVHDLLHLHFYSRFHVAYYNLVFRPLYRKCRAIICDSDFSRDEFLEWSGFPPDRCFTVHLGVSAAFGTAVLDSPSPFDFQYVFYPGNRRAYKNIARLLKGYSQSRLPRNGVKIVFTGQPDPVTAGEAATLGIGDYLIFTGFVDEAALVQLYRNALIVAFVSLYEGFGLPIVEGMAAGVPVLTSNTSSMAEIAGNAALVIDPYSVDAISAGLEVLAFDSDARQEYIRRGGERVRRFDWDLAAAKVWTIFDQIAPH
jgi:glycosyltransferase involved in cell wall biosynthesis